MIPRCPRCGDEFKFNLKDVGEPDIYMSRCGFNFTSIEHWENKHQLAEYLYDKCRHMKGKLS